MQHPLFRPSFKIPLWMNPGHGDCTTCKPCRENKKCRGYKPMEIGVVEFEVIDK